jgi:hypothetical protein
MSGGATVTASYLSESFYQDPNNYPRWQGMSSIIDDIGKAVHIEGNKGGKINGWAILCVVSGTEDVFRRLSENLNLVILVCSLLISTTLALAYNPPAQFVGGDLSYAVYTQKYCYIGIVTLSISSHFTCIIMSSLFCQAMNTCARDVDRWRIILKCDYVPSLVYLLFTLGNFCVAISIMFAIIYVYDVMAYVFAAFLIFTCGLLMHYFNYRYLIYESHAVHGWYKKFSDEYDLSIPFSRLQDYATEDQKNREARLGLGIRNDVLEK